MCFTFGFVEPLVSPKLAEGFVVAFESLLEVFSVPSKL